MFGNFWENSQVKEYLKSSYDACRSALTGGNIKAFFGLVWEGVSADCKDFWAQLVNVVTNKDGDRPVIDRISNAGTLLWGFFVELPLIIVAMAYGAACFVVAKAKVICLDFPLALVCWIVDDARVLLAMPFNKVVEMIDNREDKKVDVEAAASA